MLINRLQDYKNKINTFDIVETVLSSSLLKTKLFNDEFREFIAIEVFDFITKYDKLLENEFYRRFYYLKNLSKNNDFIKLQSDLFNTISDIISLISIKTSKKQQSLQIRNYFCTSEENFISVSKFYESAKNRNSYHFLKYQNNYCYSAYEGAVSIYTNAELVRKQYDSIDFFLNMLYGNAEINGGSDNKYNSLREKFDDYYYELFEKIYKIPKKIHTEQFEEFYTFCTGSTDACNKISYTINRNFYHMTEEEKIKKIKKITSTVIDDLIDFLKQSEKNIKQNRIEKNNSAKAPAFIVKDGKDFLFKKSLISFGENTQYENLFDIIYSNCLQEDFISYEDINKELLKKGREDISRKKINKRIQNTIANGIFRFAKLNNKKLENKLPNGKKILEIIRGRGVKFNNN